MLGFFGGPPHQNCVLRYVECHQMYFESELFGQNSIFDWMGSLEFILMPKLFSPVFLHWEYIARGSRALSLPSSYI